MPARGHIGEVCFIPKLFFCFPAALDRNFFAGVISMRYLIKNANVYTKGTFIKCDLLIEGGIITKAEQAIPADASCRVYDFSRRYVFPVSQTFMFICVNRVSYKETIKSSTMAAARSGYTAVLQHAQSEPCTGLSSANLEIQLDIIRSDALIPVYPYGAITKGEKGEAAV